MLKNFLSICSFGIGRRVRALAIGVSERRQVRWRKSALLVYWSTHMYIKAHMQRRTALALKFISLSEFRHYDCIVSLHIQCFTTNRLLQNVSHAKCGSYLMCKVFISQKIYYNWYDEFFKLCYSIWTSIRLYFHRGVASLIPYSLHIYNISISITGSSCHINT